MIIRARSFFHKFRIGVLTPISTRQLGPSISYIPQGFSYLIQNEEPHGWSTDKIIERFYSDRLFKENLVKHYPLIVRTLKETKELYDTTSSTPSGSYAVSILKGVGWAVVGGFFGFAIGFFSGVHVLNVADMVTDMSLFFSPEEARSITDTIREIIPYYVSVTTTAGKILGGGASLFEKQKNRGVECSRSCRVTFSQLSGVQL